MSSKRHLKRRQCGGKIRYPDKDAVWATRRGLGERGKPLHPYYCPWCKGYHLGHKRKPRH